MSVLGFRGVLAGSGVLANVVAPVGAAFLALTVMTLFAARSPTATGARSCAPEDRRDLAPLARSFALAGGGGYVVFVAIVAVFSEGIVGDVGAFRSAVWSGAFLLGVSVLVYGIVVAVRVGLRDRRSGGG